MALVVLQHAGPPAVLHERALGRGSTATGEVADTYTVIITDANTAIRVHDRMPVVLASDAARQCVEPGPLPIELLAPYSAEAIGRRAGCRRCQEQPDRADG